MESRSLERHTHTVFSARRKTHAIVTGNPSVCLSVTLVDHTETAQRIEIWFRSYDHFAFRGRTFTANKCFDRTSGTQPVDGQNLTNNPIYLGNGAKYDLS